MKKGISLPVNAVVVIALAVLVLLLVAFFMMGSTGQVSKVGVEEAWNEGCNALRMTYNCDANKVEEIRVGGSIGGMTNPTLLDVCRMKFGASMTKYQCRNKCCGTIIVPGLECEVPEDCQSPATSDWTCDSTHHCCPNGKHWDDTLKKCIK